MPTVTAAELYFGVPITKTERAGDGSLLVHGRATDGTLDLDEQIVDPAFARKALKEWFDDWGNVRQMHSGSLPPAGVGIELDDRDDGQYLTSKVYEAGAIKQVEEGGYKAYSVGIARPRIVRDAAAPGGRIVDGIVVEVSLVDRPANPQCKFAITKGVGSGMEVIGKAVDLGKGAKAAVTKSPDRMCPTCGVEAKKSHAFCASCGKKLPAAGDDARKAATPAADQRPPVQPGETDHRLKRLHDACCAAFSVDAVKAAYPVLEKNGIATALGPGARLALWQMLNQEVQEDGGTGSESLDIHHLGEAYKHLAEFVACEAGYPVGADGDAPATVMLAAHQELHAAFAELNKDVMPSGPDASGLPTPNGQIQPGQFRRPYLAGGHMRENGTGASAPNMPSGSGNISAQDFQRPALTDGQERQSPGSGKRAAITAMQALHDRLALQLPDLCPMDLNPASVPNNDGATPQRIALGASPAVTKAVSDARKAEKKIGPADRKAKKGKRLEKALAPHLTKIAELQATVEKLSREPDPSRAAHRGTTTVTKAVDAQAQKRAADDERERVDLLRYDAIHAPDPHRRMRAQDALAAIEKAASPS
jgi:hypothetical protein